MTLSFMKVKVKKRKEKGTFLLTILSLILGPFLIHGLFCKAGWHLVTGCKTNLVKVGLNSSP